MYRDKIIKAILEKPVELREYILTEALRRLADINLFTLADELKINIERTVQP